MSSFFRPTTAQGAKTPTLKAPAQNARTLKTQGKKAISLSLLLGMTPALAVTPAVHADAAPAKPAQTAQAAPVQVGAATTSASDADKIDLKVTTGTLNISQGGTVSVTTSPLTPEFRKKYKLFQFGLVNRGTGYE